VRLDDLQDEPGRDGRVERVAPSLEHRHPGLRGEPVGRRDHPERAAHSGRVVKVRAHHEVRVERIVLEQVHVDRLRTRLG
jgi:hypothetical protein